MDSSPLLPILLPVYCSYTHFVPQHHSGTFWGPQVRPAISGHSTSGLHLAGPPPDHHLVPKALKPQLSSHGSYHPDLIRTSYLSIALASAEFLAMTICLVNLITAESIKLSSTPNVIAKDVVLNCQPHSAFPKRPRLSINLFFYSLI